MSIKPADRLAHVSEYYFSAKLKELRRLIAEKRPVINLGIGSPDLPPHPSVVGELEQAAHQAQNHGYQPYQGIPELTEAISTFYAQKYDVQLPEGASILPMMGSKEAITHISLAYLNPGDRVLIPSLGYPTYSAVTRMVGAEPVYYPLQPDHGWLPDWDFMDGLDTTGVKLLWLNYPHMPTGTQPSPDLFRRFVAYAKSRGILLCHDNPYSFILTERPLSLLATEEAFEVSIELNSLSKTFNMAGWRVGWALGHHDLIDPVLKIKSNMDSGMFKPIQLAAVKALQLDDRWYTGQDATYQERQQVVFRILDRLGCRYAKDQAGLFVWAKVPDGDGEAFSDRMLARYDVFITPGFIFGEAGRDYVRVSLCAPESTLEEVYRRIL